MKCFLAISIPFFCFFLPLHALLQIQDECPLKILNQDLSDIETEKIILENDLRVYLISDPKAKQSAAGLAVRAGSWNNPKQFPGMAHFLEHMLFKGSIPFPDESEFTRFIFDHVGKCNAYTASDRTAYMFSIEHSAFEGALERFVHFFIDPLFETSGLNHELFVVDEEHKKNKENDGWRLHLVSKEIGNPHHPNREYGTGTSETLKQIPQNELIQWYNDHYSSNLMSLVIYSNLPLDHLKSTIVDLFSQIPNYHIDPLEISESLFSAEQKGKIISLIPVKKTNTLIIEWELPVFFATEETKSANLITFALNHGNENGLLENLKKEEWIENLDVGIEKIGSHHCLFNIVVELTEKGVKQIYRVIERIYGALHLLKQNTIPEYLYHEMKTMAETNYQYQERPDPFIFVMQHCGSLMDENLSTYPYKTLIPQGYDPSVVAKVLEYLKPQDASYYFLIDSSIKKIHPEKKEQWLGGEYRIDRIPDKILTHWERLPPNSSMQMAKPNPFIPATLKQEIKEEEEKFAPIKLIDDERGKIFFLSNTPFSSPKISWLLRIKNPLIDGHPRSFTLLNLYLKMLTNQLQTLFQKANDAGFQISIQNKGLSLQIQLDGYNEKASLLLKEMIKAIKTYKPTKEEFQLCYTVLKKDCENAEKQLPLHQAFQINSSLLVLSNPSPSQQHSELLSLTFSDLLTFHKKFFSSTYIEGIFCGSITEKEVVSIWQDIQDTLASEPYPIEKHQKKEVLLLSSLSKPTKVMKSSSSLGSGVVLTIGQGDFSFKKKAAQQILSQVLREAFFTALRTKQKTAYIAFSRAKEIETQLFQIFAVQSSNHTTEDLLHRFELFFESFLSDLPNIIDSNRFDDIRKSLISEISSPIKNLHDLAKYCNKLAFRYGEDFEWHEKKIAALEELSYDEFVSFVQNTLSEKNPARLAVFCRGTIEDSFEYHRLSFEKIQKQARYLSSTSKEVVEAISQ